MEKVIFKSHYRAANIVTDPEKIEQRVITYENMIAIGPAGDPYNVDIVKNSLNHRLYQMAHEDLPTNISEVEAFIDVKNLDIYILDFYEKSQNLLVYDLKEQEFRNLRDYQCENTYMHPDNVVEVVEDPQVIGLHPNDYLTFDSGAEIHKVKSIDHLTEGFSALLYIHGEIGHLIEVKKNDYSMS